MSRRGNVGPAFSLFAFQDIITSVTGIMILVTLVLALELIQRAESSPSERRQQAVQDIQASIEEVQATFTRNQARIAELQKSLQQGEARLGKVANFDRRGVETDVSNLQKINSKMEEGLSRLADESASIESNRQEVEEKANARSLDQERIKQLLADIEAKKQALEVLKKSNRVIFNPTEGDAKTPWLIEVTADALTVAKIGVSAPPTVIPVPPELDPAKPNFADFFSWVVQRNRNTEYFVLLVKPSGSEVFQFVKAVLEQMRFDLGYDLLSADQTAIDPLKGAASE